MDTIVALSTPPGRSAIAVVRISGSLVPGICAVLAGKSLPERKASLVSVRDLNGEIIDQAILIRFGYGTSYTGEELLECQIHGSVAVIRRLIALLVDALNCRLAEPGEFTRRALSNGKLDLLAVEALGDLIDSETEQQRRQALNALGGGLRDEADALADEMLALRAHLTAHIDFSDEGDVGSEEIEPLRVQLRSICARIAGLLARAQRAERMREGFRVAICGLPNAGKSSLLNALAGREIAIVHALPGTTRDRLEVAIDLEGYPVVLFDTAGIRAATDVVEQLGIERGRKAAEDADIAVWLAAADDPSAPPQDWRVRDWVRITSKDDNGAIASSVSVKRASGLDAIRSAILQRISLAGDTMPIVVARERQRIQLQKALTALERAAALNELELIDAELQLSQRALAELAGKTGIENVLDSLFSRFCIGK